MPKEVLKNAQRIGNVFDENKSLKQALETIEKIASINNEDNKREDLNNIYRISHAFNGRCKKPHRDWIKLEEEIRRDLKDY